VDTIEDMLNKPKKLLFGMVPEFADVPKPAQQYIPEWYAKSERFVGGEAKIKQEGGANKGLKLCFPYLDALTSGYTVELWTDVQVKQTIDGPQFKWMIDPQPVNSRDAEPAKLLPIPLGCGKHQFVWMLPTCFKSPPGYSVLITHPLNRHDLPFVTLSGVIDADKGIAMGNYPFFLQKDFEGVIEAGTPIAQIIPFKRESWEAEKDQSLVILGEKINYLSNRYIKGGFYKKNVWSKKTYK
jgi:hypothetical protein